SSIRTTPGQKTYLWIFEMSKEHKISDSPEVMNKALADIRAQDEKVINELRRPSVQVSTRPPASLQQTRASESQTRYSLPPVLPIGDQVQRTQQYQQPASSVVEDEDVQQSTPQAQAATTVAKKSTQVSVGYIATRPEDPFLLRQKIANKAERDEHR